MHKQEQNCRGPYRLSVNCDQNNQKKSQKKQKPQAMPKATWWQRPGRRTGSRISMKTLIKNLIEKHLVKGWGKRQLIKLGAVVIPYIGISQHEWDGVIATSVAGALVLLEIIFSKMNAKRLGEKK